MLASEHKIRKRGKQHALKLARAMTHIHRIQRDPALARRRKLPKSGSDKSLPSLRVDGKRAFWTVRCGDLGIVVGCRRPMDIWASLGMELGVLAGEPLLTVTSKDVALPWRPCCAGVADETLSLARIDSARFGTVYVVCGAAVERKGLGCGRRGVDRLQEAVRSVMNL